MRPSTTRVSDPAASDDRAAATPTVLDVRRLCLDLTVGRVSVPVVRDVSFQVRAGEILGLVGESGSGKSLTASSVMRMLPKAISVAGGEVRYQGRDILALPESEVTALRGDRIGMVFQDPMAYLNPLMTVGQQIRECLRLHGMPVAQARARAVELLGLVGVHEPERREADYPHQFSGGMRQRVVIAMAVANDPALLVADEPTTALDVTLQAEILGLLSGLRDRLGTAILLITHDIGVVQDVCDSVMVMYAGNVVEQGRVADVLGDPQHPYTRELMRSTPRLDVPVQRRLHAIAGSPPDVMRRPTGCAFHPRCPLAVERCVEEHPPLEAGGDGTRLVACWRAGEAPPVAVTGTRPEPDGSDQDRPEAILVVESARVGYQSAPGFWRRSTPKPVVDGVDLRAYPGRTLGLVGESGCGKSTLARAIVGLLPLQSGLIEVDGLRWQDADPDQRLRLRRTVQLVFQDAYTSLDPRQTVSDAIAEPLAVHRLVPRAGRTARVAELLSLVGLPASVRDRYPYQLSGGQRQRVGLARALAVEPRLVVADEPVSALDVSIQAQIINLLADLRDELGLSYVVITHDLSVVRHLCDDVAVMQHGRVVEQGVAEQVFESPQHPYTLSLLAATPGSGHLRAPDAAPRQT